MPYEEYMNKWTLSFVTESDECRFHQEIYDSMQMPLFIRWFLYVGIAHHCFARTFALYAIRAGLPVPTGTLTEEIALSLYIILTMTIEFWLYHISVLKWLRGCLFYVCFPLVVVLAAFITQKAPRFGIMYLCYCCDSARSGFALSNTICGCAFFVPCWRKVAACNFVVGILSVVAYCHYFWTYPNGCIRDVFRRSGREDLALRRDSGMQQLQLDVHVYV